MTPSFRIVGFLSLLGFVACVNGGPGDEGDDTFHADPELVDFGFVDADASSQPVEIQLVNDTSNNIEISAITISESGDEGFALWSTPPFTDGEPVEVVVGDDIAISAFFAPTTVGVFHSAIEITSNADGDETLVIEMGGCSTGPACTSDVGDDDDDDSSPGDDDDSVGDDDDTGAGDITVAPMTWNFGNVAENQSPVGKVFVIDNAGAEPLTVDAVSIAGADAGLFTAGGFNGGTIQASGAPINLQVQFDPAGASLGAKSAEIVIESDDPDEGTLHIPLSATVSEDCGSCTPVLTIVGAIDNTGVEAFYPGFQYLQVTTGQVDVEVQNSGSGTLGVTQVTEGGSVAPDNPAFQYVGGAPLSLEAGQSGELQFTVGQAGCEVINFDGVYAFTMGTLPPTLNDLFGCLGL